MGSKLQQAWVTVSKELEKSAQAREAKHRPVTCAFVLSHLRHILAERKEKSLAIPRHGGKPLKGSMHFAWRWLCLNGYRSLRWEAY